MKKENIDIYICEFCGIKNESEDWMKLHEQVCIKNPINMPCSRCSNMIINFGCSFGIDCDKIGGKVLCMKYSEGEPKNPLPGIILQGNPFDDDNKS